MRRTKQQHSRAIAASKHQCTVELSHDSFQKKTSTSTPPERSSLGAHQKLAQTQTFESGYFRWDGGVPREGVGAKKFGIPLETREIKLFGRDIPGFCSDIPAAPEKFEKKKFLFNCWSLFKTSQKSPRRHKQ